MRALCVIVRKNAEAAGGEAGHAALDHDYPLALDIAAAVGDDTVGSAFAAGHSRGTLEG